MKKIMNKINFAIIAVMASAPAFAEELHVTSEMCTLFQRLHGVFNILRIMAFLGAAFYIAGWAWGYISGGEAKTDDIKKKGIALLVGFGLLFMIGAILTFIMSASGAKMLGCDVLQKW